MSQSPPPTREEFARLVQDALNRLYDSPYLLSHPLAKLLVGDAVGAAQRGQHLRRTLLDAIHALCPADGTPAQSVEWRAYRILELRYIESLTPPEIIQQLAFSRSYYFREQARMLDALTDVLWEQWQRARPLPAPPQEATREQLAQAETERLFARATWQAVDLVQVLGTMRPLIASLAQAQAVALQIDLPQPMTVLHADRVLLRQALFNAISYALDVASGGQVAISSVAETGQIGVRILARSAARLAADTAQRHAVGLDVCRRFMAAMGGTVDERRAGDTWQARLAWPAAPPHTLLVIDDNQDFADLFRRYLAGRNWQVVGAADGTTARRLLADLAPTAITLDVMMPHEDGWEVLAALRADPRTSATPIIICSVLNEPHLARALGASAYLTKPVTQTALLLALEQWEQAGPSPEPGC